MKLMLSDVRIAFATLFTPKTVNGEGEASYSAVFIIDPKNKAQVKALNDAVKATAEEKWGAKAGAILAELQKKGKVCYVESAKTNGSGDPYDGFEGNFHISTRAKVSARPTVIDRNKSPLTQNDGRPYSGCFVNANLELWAQDNNTYGKRINCQLRGVQFVRDGDSFGGGSPASADEFDDMEGSDADDLA